MFLKIDNMSSNSMWIKIDCFLRELSILIVILMFGMFRYLVLLSIICRYNVVE